MPTGPASTANKAPVITVQRELRVSLSLPWILFNEPRSSYQIDNHLRLVRSASAALQDFSLLCQGFPLLFSPAHIPYV